jgi:TnpA family transposase
VARHRINTDLIAHHWDDLLRVAGSLKLGVVAGHDLMQTFQGGGRHSSLARALAEYGRIGKTLHLLDLVDDEAYRRSLLAQVNTGERRHALWLGVYSTVAEASCIRRNARDRRINSARLAWC